DERDRRPHAEDAGGPPAARDETEARRRRLGNVGDPITIDLEIPSNTVPSTTASGESSPAPPARSMTQSRTKKTAQPREDAEDRGAVARGSSSPQRNASPMLRISRRGVPRRSSVPGDCARSRRGKACSRAPVSASPQRARARGLRERAE